MTRRALRAVAVAAFVAAANAAAGQDEAVGPCSPIRAAGGDIPSEMPGCARRHRAAPGSLDDELRFRRARERDAAEPDDDEDLPVRHRGRHSRVP